MNAKLVSSVVRCLGLLFVLAAFGVSAPATVITTGYIDPGGAATQPDPWSIGGSLSVPYEGNGTLNIEAEGEVSNSWGYIGRSSGSTGVATVSGAGSKWTNSSSLSVGYSGNGTLNIEAGGEVSNSWGYIGDESGSTGIAPVTVAMPVEPASLPM